MSLLLHTHTHTLTHTHTHSRKHTLTHTLTQTQTHTDKDFRYNLKERPMTELKWMIIKRSYFTLHILIFTQYMPININYKTRA